MKNVDPDLKQLLLVVYDKIRSFKNLTKLIIKLTIVYASKL